MAQWKKVIVSGSVAELNTVSASLAVVVGASGYNKIGTDQTNTVLSGSFTGSFVGEGSGLTGLVSTLGITGSDNSTGTVQLKTQNLTLTGASNEVNTTISGQTVTIGLVDSPILIGNLQLGGNVIKNSVSASVITLSGNDVHIAGDVKVGGNDILASDGATNITLTSNTLTSFAGDVKIGGNDIQASDGNNNITLTSNTLTAFAGDIKVGGNDIQASDGNNNITLTSNTLTAFAGDIKVVGNTISSSTATAIELNGSDVEVRGDLQVTGNDIKSSTGATAITLTAANVSMPGNLSVAGDLTVNGDLTYLNVANLLVEDKFVLLNSGSNSAPAEGGIIVDQGGQSGSAYAWDTGTSRWGFTGSLAYNATSFVPDAYVASVVTSDIPAYQQVGNIRVQGGEIYIYV